MHSASSLPPEVQALEAQSAALLFDRDTRSEHVAYAEQSIELQLERSSDIQSLKVYGAAPYELSVQAKVADAWSPVAGLDKLRLDRLPTAWNTFSASRSTRSAALRLILTPTAPAGTATSGGLPEIEIWAAGEHSLVRDNALVQAVQQAWPLNNDGSASSTASYAIPAQTRVYNAKTAGVTVGQGGQRISFELDRAPSQLRRAWLVYEAYGVAHWVSPVRRINGQALGGGELVFAATQWNTLSEPIAPGWLRQGSNHIDFSLPPGSKGSYSVRKLRLIAEVDDGHNLIARAVTAYSGNTPGIDTDTPALLDGDFASGWSPWRDARAKALSSARPELSLYFDKPTQLDELRLHLVNPLAGTIGVDLLVDGQWQNAGLNTVNGAKLGAGWNTLNGFARVAAQAVLLSFQNGAGSAAEIKEITAAGSGVGATWPAAIVLTYPEDSAHGPYYGRSAYLRGHLSLADNGSGPATLQVQGSEPDSGTAGRTASAATTTTVAAKPVPLSDGGFGLRVSKDEMGYGAQSDAQAWAVWLVARYPDGQRLVKRVVLEQGQDASKARGQLPGLANPGFAALINTDEAGLEIDPDAVTGEEKIRITPLSEAQLPRLDPGMTNVTKGPRKGYRFSPTPHKFKKAIRVTLPYDAALVPRGHTEADIKTYYYDKQAGRWVPLDLAHLDRAKKRVTSLTDHFTDMINATLTVPDHPQTVN
ncbi:MAG: hypothetical protein OEW36_12040, partial [Hylemonella sp.]|nr:hypothetical protein [Hylemonella sp.]